ncbi:unnamed protein product [Brassica napus]|uniref:(rape) hypothetical protein n=1 Tax=Brassica napus TaxID=3708 RepID=A0A816M510_BRANA|nr:unnamed protein product [Brassica napus]
MSNSNVLLANLKAGCLSTLIQEIILISVKVLCNSLSGFDVTRSQI